jgi:hypothetical protein
VRVGLADDLLDVEQLGDPVPDDGRAVEAGPVEVVAGPESPSSTTSRMASTTSPTLRPRVEHTTTATTPWPTRVPAPPSSPAGRIRGRTWSRYRTSSRPPTCSIEAAGNSSSRLTVASGIATCRSLPTDATSNASRVLGRSSSAWSAPPGAGSRPAPRTRALGEREDVEDQDHRTITQDRRPRVDPDAPDRTTSCSSLVMRFNRPDAWTSAASPVAAA